MNRTQSLAVNETPKIKCTADAQQLGLGPVPVKRQRPTIAQLREAMDTFRIRGMCRTVAYELLSYWTPTGITYPAVGTMADGIGVKPRTIKTHLARLERVGLWVRIPRTGQTNVYDLRFPGPVRADEPVAGGGDRGITPGMIPRSPKVTNEVEVPPPAAALPEHLTAIEGSHGVKCRRCSHSWPKVAGLSHICVDRPEKPQRTRKDRARPPRDSAVRSMKIDQARRERKRIESH